MSVTENFNLTPSTEGSILVFCGTADGSLFVRLAAGAGYSVTASVASDYGEHDLNSIIGDLPNVEILSGRMNTRQMQELITKRGYSAVVDATHPYAVEVTRNINFAAECCEVAYYRLLRQKTDFSLREDEDIIIVSSVEEAVKLVASMEGRIFLTTGSNSVEQFANAMENAGRNLGNLFIRVLPSVESIEKCRNAGIPFDRIIAMQGPFSKELNESMFRFCGCNVLVTKDGGAPAGMEEKLSAAKECAMKVIVIARPEESVAPEKSFSLEELAKELGIKPVRSCLLVSAGMGQDGGFTKEALEAIKNATVLISSQRLIEQCPPVEGQTRLVAIKPEEIVSNLELNLSYVSRPVVLFSGDSGFYSGCAGLLPVLKERGWDYSIQSGVSTPSALAAKLAKPWQDWKLVSAHGRKIDAALELMRAESGKCFYLCGGELEPEDIVRTICRRGAGEALVVIAENLSLKDERITCDTAAALNTDIIAENFSCLKGNLKSVFVDASKLKKALPQNVSGLEDSFFIRGFYDEEEKTPVPMTKQIVRSAILAKLGLNKDDIFFDIGSGTGTVAVEAAVMAKCSVYAIEREANACRLIARNRANAAAWSIELVCGTAPAVFEQNAILAGVIPTAAFVGGSSGNLTEILSALLKRNSAMKILVAAVTLETLYAARLAAENLGLESEITQIALSPSKALGKLTTFMPQIPVFLISLKKG